MQQMQQSPRSQSSSASISLSASASGESSSELFSNDDPDQLEETFGGSHKPMTGTTMQMQMQMQMPDDLYEEDFD